MTDRRFSWDADKALANLEKHGVPFDDVIEFDWASAIQRDDTRFDYPERRVQAYGNIRGRLHVLIYTIRDGTVRVISLRKANARERR